MATYKSKPQLINRSADELFDRFSDLSRLQEALDTLPEEQRAKVGQVEFTPDSIRITTPQVGDIAFNVIERIRPTKVVFGTQSSPVPMTMDVDITPMGDASCEVVSSINVEIPAMLRPLIGPQLQKATDKFGELIAGLSH